MHVWGREEVTCKDYRKRPTLVDINSVNTPLSTGMERGDMINIRDQRIDSLRDR